MCESEKGIFRAMNTFSCEKQLNRSFYWILEGYKKTTRMML